MMMNTEEKMMPSVEEEVKEEAESEEEEEDDESGGEKICDSDDDDDDDEEEGKDDVKKEVEATLQATGEKVLLPIDATEKKQQANVLNLNNEVVKMRKEVKRVRALIIRKLTRQIAALKKKKGNETEVERNQRRAARLLEEVHSMKNLSPDLVTKTALQKKLNFDQVCRNPKSSISDRAVARIATHPQFSKKIESIKAAVKAFKEERMKSGMQEEKAIDQMQTEKVTLPSQDRRGKRETEKKEEDEAGELQEIADTEEGVDVLKDTEDVADAGAEKEKEKDAHSAGGADIHRKEVPDSAAVRPTSVKSSDAKVIVKTQPKSKAAEKKTKPPPAPVALQKRPDEDESDVESSDNEEKEYFDDSTEERFHKQSSQSEESDDDDFFVGKVSKFKKKKTKQQGMEGERKGVGQEVKKDSTDGVESSDKLQRELDELESRLKSKATALQSVFCPSLTGTKAGRGRGGAKFLGQGKPKSLNRDFSKQSKFQNQERGASNSGSDYSKREDGKVSASAGRGRGRGRGDDRRQRDLRGGGVFSHQTPQPALHPSWEASKKRKEQQGQILAFQGKKIKFDDDD
ncbi:serum response factor-binding protein 1 [Leuresthes tenuis]|uniref:serum response factor-binding protein 1 n=1 Tax=Leuresthes tenuis TaxID=355514 RepID=UPI003B5069D7